MGSIGPERRRIEVLPLREPASPAPAEPARPAPPAQPAREPAPAK